MSISSMSPSNGVSRVRRRLDEGIEVDGHQVNQRDAVLVGGRQVVGAAPASEDAAVHQRMEGLDPAVHHLGKPGDVRDSDDVRPACWSTFAVPPVETSSKPRAARPLANSTSPVLSETLNNALGIGSNGAKCSKIDT